MPEVKISIIVPIYNKENIVSKCIESCLRQSLEEIEIILVDDGSTDGSPLICDEFAKDDCRIRVIHKQNGGLSSARNAGLDIATGKYIGFVDGDDFVANDMFELLYDVAKEHDADISMCSYYVCKKNKKEPKSETGKFSCFSNNQAMKALLDFRSINVSVWNKIYSQKLFDNVRFDENQKYSEDGTVTYKLFGECSKFCSIDLPKYYYVQWENSQSNRKISLKIIEDSLFTAESIFEYVSKNYPEYSKEAYGQLVYSYSVNLYRLLGAYGGKSAESRELLDQLRSSINDLLSNGELTKEWKALRLFLKISRNNLWLCEVASKLIYKFRQK